MRIDPLTQEALLGTLQTILHRQRSSGLHDITVVLVALDTTNLDHDKTKAIYNYIKNHGINTIKAIVRKNDEIYILDQSTILIHLKDTHEAGADFVANRIKKALSYGAKEATDQEAYFCVGTFSEPVITKEEVNEILKHLTSSMELEGQCQPFFLDRFHGTYDVGIGPVYTFGISESTVEALRQELIPIGYTVEPMEGTPDDLIGQIQGRDTNAVFLIGSDATYKHVNDIVKKIRSKRELDCIFIVINRVEDEEWKGADLVIKEDCPDPKELLKHLLAGYHVSLLRTLSKTFARFNSILESISGASHKLNQPLQIMTCKIELVELGVVAPDDTREVLSEIKKNILQVSQINSKIGRIASGEKV